jgi:diguanylate cyclase (GGDEF)-like protein/PAS domain S-box-containing protein/putative nucleotidyltransferase with HDIG domain
MAWQSNPYVYLMLAAGLFSAGVACFTLLRPRVPGSIPLTVITFVGTFWAWTAGLELASATLSNAAFFHKLSFFGMEAVGIAWFVFAAKYSGRDRWMTPPKLLGVMALPLITLVLVWTNGWHGLVFESLRMEAVGAEMLLRKIPGIWWWIDSVYTYALLLLGIGMLGHMLLREFGLYRRQIVALLVGVVGPMGADAFYVITRGSEPVNIAPALFAWVGLALYWGFTRYQLLDVTPVAREFVAEHLGDALIVTDTEERITYFNPVAEELLGVDLRAAIGKSVAHVMADRPGMFPVYERARWTQGGKSQEWEYHGRFYDGKVSTLRDSRGRIRGTILVLRDTTDRKTAELALDDARRELEDRVIERTAELAAEKEHLAKLNTVAVEIARCGTSTDVLNTGVRVACEAVGCDEGTLWLRSRKGRMQLLRNDKLDRVAWQALEELLQRSREVEMAMAEGTTVCVRVEEPAEAETAVESGSPVSEPSKPLGFSCVLVVPLISRGLNLGALCLLSADPMFGAHGETPLLAGAVASQIAVALENARRYEDVQFLAERDSLTRLLNHRGISKRLDQEVALCKRAGGVFGLVMIDVDNFKLFNDAYGHVVGDRVLQGVARILTTSLRRSDIVARYGGDEFIAVLPATDAEAAVHLVERVRNSLEDSPFLVEDGRTIPLKMSYGVATFPHDGRTAAELLAAADANLYRSKRHGGDFITASGSDDSQRPVSMGSFSVLDGLVTTVDSKDHYTRRHSDNVTEYALALAFKMGLSLDTQRALRVAALLHDVGKLGVPDHILRKPSNLTEEEFEIIKNHVTLGELIIQGIPNQEEVLSAVSTHHERWDGKGYPRGLKGEEIPLLGRILAVTDAYSAMTTDRPYRKALSARDAKTELKQAAGTQLDPEIVSVFLEVLEDEEARHESRVAVFASGRF